MLLCLTMATHLYAQSAGPRADDHAPLGVMGDHFHERGEWMVSYRFMHMAMEGNRIGSTPVTPDDIVTTEPNRFFGMPMQPPTLRVVPLNMSMDMHMLGVMYAPDDWITLMLMGNYVEKSMDHVTYMGAAGTTVLGEFTTRSSGLGDTRASALMRIFDGGDHRLHGTVGLSLPTGAKGETGTVLTPLNTMPELRLPYPMQLGSGTFDPIVGLTWMRFFNAFSIGAQWQSVFRLSKDQGYRLGHEHDVTAWASYLWQPAISTSFRIKGYRRGGIKGLDPAIVAPVQTADPDRQTIKRLDLGLGLNLAGQGNLEGHRLAIEALLPVHRRLRGPQLESDWTLTLGYQVSF